MHKIICILIFLLLLSCANENILTSEKKNIEMSHIKTQIAIEFMKNNDFRNALLAINEAISFNNKNDNAWLIRALIYQSLSLIPQADTNYKKALALNFKNSEASNNYGWFLCSVKKQAQASIKYFDNALADPTYSTPYLALLNKGICEAKLNNLSDAEKNIRQAILISPAGFKEPIKELAKIKYDQNNFIGAYNLFNDYRKGNNLDEDGLLLGWKITKSLNKVKENLIYENLLKKNNPYLLETKSIGKFYENK